MKLAPEARMPTAALVYHERFFSALAGTEFVIVFIEHFKLWVKNYPRNRILSWL